MITQGLSRNRVILATAGTALALLLTALDQTIVGTAMPRIIAELNGFDNLYYEVCNEPYFGGVTEDWQRRIVDVIVEANLKPYDIVALVPIITGAGGVVTNWEGGPAALGGRIVAVGDPGLHAEVLALLAG